MGEDDQGMKRDHWDRTLQRGQNPRKGAERGQKDKKKDRTWPRGQEPLQKDNPKPLQAGCLRKQVKRTDSFHAMPQQLEVHSSW